MKKLILFFIVTTIFYYSCSEKAFEDMSLNEESEIKLNQQQGFLIFKSEATLNKTLNKIKGLSSRELVNWESKYGDFVSQKTIYEKAFTEDEKYVKKLSELSDNEINRIKKERGDEFGFSKFTLKNKDLFSFLEDVHGYDLKVGEYDPEIIYVINKSGIVQVGDSIYQYNPKNIKIIRDGQTSKLSELKHITESNLEKNVAVISIMKIDANTSNLRTQFWKNGSCTDYTSQGGQKVIGKVVSGFNYTIDFYGNYGYPGQYLAKPYAYLKATNYIDHWLLGWKKKKTSELEIIGNNIDADFGVTSRNNVHVHKTTSSDVKEITSYIIYPSKWYPLGTTPGNQYYTFSGDATFRGRGNTECDL